MVSDSQIPIQIYIPSTGAHFISVQSVIKTSKHPFEFHPRSVLLATMLAPAYESSIDTLEDLLATEKEILVPTGTKTAKLLRLDPKEDVRTLHKKVTFYNIIDGKHPKPVLEG